MNSEGRVFLSKLSKTDTELINVSLALRLNSDTNNRIRECHRLEYDRMCLIAKSITCTDILETNTSTDITGIDSVHRNLLV